MITLRTLASAAALTAMLTGGAVQARADSDDHHPSMMQHGDHHGMGVPYEHIEGHLAFLKAELKIDDTQTAKWNEFADAARSNAAAVAEMHAKANESDDDLALPQFIEKQEKMLASHLDLLHKFNAAFSPLYALLNGKQKHIADELFKEMCDEL